MAKEADEKRDEVLKRLLKTPPQPKKTAKRENELPLDDQDRRKANPKNKKPG